MTTVQQLVADAGGLLHKHDLVAAGATDRHLTAAVRFGRVRRPRRGWYSTWEPTDPRFVAVSVGGRLTGAAALHFSGAWMWRRPPVTVSVPVGASRLRRRRGVTVVWDPPDVSARGTTSCVDPRDALARMVDELSFEDAVAVATWAVREGVVPREELRDALGARRSDAADLAEWVEEACESFLEVVALVRLRIRGHEVHAQGAVGARQRVDLVVDGTIALELDGRATHESTFVADRSKDLTILAEALVPMRLPYSLVRDEWPRVEATLELVLRQHGGCGRGADVGTVGNSCSWSVLGPHGKRPWRLRRRARHRGGVADRDGGGQRRWTGEVGRGARAGERGQEAAEGRSGNAAGPAAVGR